MKKKALGKGLKAFLPEEYGILKEDRLMEVEIEKLTPSPSQPRTRFDEQALNELAESIRETGILQPVVVVPAGENYQIVVGERRWRAAQIAGLKKIPALIRNMTPEQQQEAGLIENLQREDLNPMEIAAAYHKISQDLKYTQEEIAEKVGKDRASVANYMRLLKLPDEIQNMIRENRLSMGHARALITLSDPALQSAAAQQIIREALSVRRAEKLAYRLKKVPHEKQRPLPDPDLMAVQEDMVKLLGTKVIISGNSGRGVIKINYFSVDELNRIYDKIKGDSE